VSSVPDALVSPSHNGSLIVYQYLHVFFPLKFSNVATSGTSQVVLEPVPAQLHRPWFEAEGSLNRV